MTPSGESAPALASRYTGVASTAARAYLCFGVLAVVLSSVLGGSNPLHGFGAGTAPAPSALDAVWLGGDLLVLLAMAWLVISVGGKRDLGSLLWRQLHDIVVEALNRHPAVLVVKRVGQLG